MRMKIPNTYAFFLLLVGLFVLLAKLTTPGTSQVNAGSLIQTVAMETRSVTSTDLEEEAKTRLSSAMRDSTLDDYPFPPGTEVDGVTIQGENAVVDLHLPVKFLEGELDASQSDAMVRFVVDALEPLGLRNFHVRAATSVGEFLPLSDFLPPLPATIQKMPPNLDPQIPAHYGPASRFPGQPPIPGQGQPQGALSGKTVWLSAGHGWLWTGYRWETQRPNTFGVVEDFSNAEAVNAYLARYLWNAGADVYLVRERSMNENEIIIDNDDGAPGYSETGVWSTSLSSGYQGGVYRYAVTESSSSATATWRPEIPAVGWYPVYVWYRHSANRPNDARYQIYHSGGLTAVSISQEVHGETWRYLGEYYFEAGNQGYVTLLNQSSDVGQAVIADAVRFGGGMGSIDRGLGTSGKPRWEEAALYYAQFQGYPVSETTNDVIVRPLYAEWELANGYPDEDGVFVSWHTNCCNKSGTLSFIHSFEPTPGSASLRAYIHQELLQVLRAGWDPDWQDRGQLSADFGEVRELTTMPGMLLEVAYHDTETPGDADDLKEASFRQLAAQAVYQGIVKYFAYKDGHGVNLLPEPPTHLVARNSAPGAVTLTWREPPVHAGVIGGAASAYKVYRSSNGRGFDNGVVVLDNSITIDGLVSGELYFFRVSALNPGGESFPTPVVAVKTTRSGSSPHFLLIDGFDRLDKEALIPKEESGAGNPLGTPLRMYLERMNRYDYAVEHAQALHSCGYAFDGALNEAVADGDINLFDYPALDWFLGEESNQDEALSGVERSLLAAYLGDHRGLLLSGSQIGWHLARPEGGADASFFNHYLRGAYLGEDASTYDFSGIDGSPFDGIFGSFDDSTHGCYDVDKPDRIAPSDGSSVAINYLGGTGDGAAIIYKGDYNLVYFAFPLETVIDPLVRNALICRSAGYILGPIPSEQYLPYLLSSHP